MNNFCTITSPDYLPFVEATFESIHRYDATVVLYVLVTGTSKPINRQNVFYLNTNDLSQDLARPLLEKYSENNDYLRWSLKPVLLLHLLKDVEKIIYIDNDIYFFNSFQFLFDLLERHSILLSPHWCRLNPFEYPDNFLMSFQSGLFNAGFIGASSKAKTFLNWWFNACLFAMERNFAKGLFVDQRYLDMATILVKDLGILRHLGCNLGSWNLHQNKRTIVNKKILINRKFPVVFIHFNNETIKHISNGNDQELKSYLDRYLKTLKKCSINLEDFKSYSVNEKILIKIKRKLRLRTRLKFFLHSLANKL